MGSEQSSNPNQASQEDRSSRIGQLRRGKSVPDQKRSDTDNIDLSRPGSISPGPSICSDSDLPYISYTVNRPIGDSPKLPTKHTGHLNRGKSLGSASGILSSSARKPGLRKQSTTRVTSGQHNIIVVKPALPLEDKDKDPDIVRLQNVPMFLPIMRGTLNLPAVRDPEVLERLDPNALYKLCLHYQTHLNQCSTLVAEDQAILSQKIREVDSETARLLTIMTERQKAYAKFAERMNKVHELSHQINKCHLSLNQTLDTMEALNNALPADQRLEPFVWTTG